jgi:hypothetical protein
MLVIIDVFQCINRTCVENHQLSEHFSEAAL